MRWFCQTHTTAVNPSAPFKDFGAFVEAESKRLGAVLDQLNLGAKK